MLFYEHEVKATMPWLQTRLADDATPRRPAKIRVTFPPHSRVDSQEEAIIITAYFLVICEDPFTRYPHW